MPQLNYLLLCIVLCDFLFATNIGKIIKSDEKVQHRKLVEWTGKRLGKGSYGEVLEVKTDRKKYAAKQLNPRTFWENFGKEIAVLSNLDHPNIVHYHGIGYFEDNKLPLLLMELMETNLQNHLSTNPNLPLPKKMLILLDVSKGLAYLHAGIPPILHGDLTAKNVLLDSRTKAKIADFGKSRITNIESGKQDVTFHHIGTLDYMPPEALNTESGYKYNKKLDVFSFGHLALCTVVQRFSCKLLPNRIMISCGQTQIVSEVERRRECFNILDQYVPEIAHELVRLIKDCLNNVYYERPPARKICCCLAEMTDMVPFQLEEMSHFRTNSSSSHDTGDWPDLR